MFAAELLRDSGDFFFFLALEGLTFFVVGLPSHLNGHWDLPVHALPYLNMFYFIISFGEKILVYIGVSRAASRRLLLHRQRLRHSCGHTPETIS